MLLPVSVVARLKVLVPTVLVASTQVLPLSRLICTFSPARVLVLRVPERVCAAVLVTKSVLLLPVSALKASVLTALAGSTSTVVVTLRLRWPLASAV